MRLCCGVINAIFLKLRNVTILQTLLTLCKVSLCHRQQCWHVPLQAAPPATGSSKSRRLSMSSRTAAAAAGSTSGGARKVTPQRKQNNRKAQQRYREKRKAQARAVYLFTL